MIAPDKIFTESSIQLTDAGITLRLGNGGTISTDLRALDGLFKGKESLENASTEHCYGALLMTVGLALMHQAGEDIRLRLLGLLALLEEEKYTKG